MEFLEEKNESNIFYNFYKVSWNEPKLVTSWSNMVHTRVDLDAKSDAFHFLFILLFFRFTITHSIMVLPGKKVLNYGIAN